MKVTYALFLAAVVGLASPAAYAQTGIAGKWTGELSAAQGRGAAQPITVELKLEGDTLSGSVTEGALGARPIANAAVEGSTFSFRTTQNFGGQDIVVNWFGEVKGDELALTRGIGPTVEVPAGGGGGRGGAAGGGARGAGGAAGAGGARGGAAAAPAPAPGAAPAAGRGAAGGAPPAGAQDGAARGGAAAGGARGGGAAAGGRGGGGGRGAAAAPAGVVRVNGGITLNLRRSA